MMSLSGFLVIEYVFVPEETSRTVVFGSLEVETRGRVVGNRIKVPPVGCPGFGFNKYLYTHTYTHIYT